MPDGVDYKIYGHDCIFGLTKPLDHIAFNWLLRECWHVRILQQIQMSGAFIAASRKLALMIAQYHQSFIVFATTHN